jgi:hypothetical protein
MRQEQTLPKLREFADWLDAQAILVLPKSPMAQAINYVRNHWRALLRFTEHGFLNIDNNASERAMRPAALGRKNFLFAGSDEGGRTTAVLYTLTQSCRRHGIDPFAYLQDVLRRLPLGEFQQLADLFPNRWAAAQRAKAINMATPVDALNRTDAQKQHLDDLFGELASRWKDETSSLLRELPGRLKLIRLTSRSFNLGEDAIPRHAARQTSSIAERSIVCESESSTQYLRICREVIRALTPGPSGAEPQRLPIPAPEDCFPHQFARGAVLLCRKLLERHGRHLDMQVDSVQERTADSAHVFFDLHRRAFAGVFGVSHEAAGARVHRRHQNETRWKRRRIEGTRDGDTPFLQRLPQDFEASAIEFGQLVEKQDAVMSQTDLAWSGHTAAADHAGIANGVMRRSKRSYRQERFARGQPSQCAVNARCFQAFVRGQQRQNRRKTPGKHGLSRTGAADHQDIVTPGGCDNQSSLREFLPATAIQT